MILDFIFFKFYFILFSIASCWKVVCMYDSWIRERDSKYDSRRIRSVVLVVGSCTKNRRILEFKCETSGVKFHIARTMWKWRVFVQARTKVKFIFLLKYIATYQLSSKKFGGLELNFMWILELVFLLWLNCNLNATMLMCSFIYDQPHFCSWPT